MLLSGDASTVSGCTSPVNVTASAAFTVATAVPAVFVAVAAGFTALVSVGAVVATVATAARVRASPRAGVLSWAIFFLRSMFRWNIFLLYSSTCKPARLYMHFIFSWDY